MTRVEPGETTQSLHEGGLGAIDEEREPSIGGGISRCSVGSFRHFSVNGVGRPSVSASLINRLSTPQSTVAPTLPTAPSSETHCDPQSHFICLCFKRKKPKSRVITVGEEGKSTITKGILSTSGFIWTPSISPRHKATIVDDKWFAVALGCERMYSRRNALADPETMAMPQLTREKIEADIADRKSSVTRKVSRYLKGIYDKDMEEDLT